MIYTLTINPSLDYIVHTDVVPYALNRSSKETLYPGGKGINVSVMLARLGYESTAITVIAGETGKILEGMLKNVIKTEFIRLEQGMTRINLKALGSEGETEINGRGVKVDFEMLKDKLDDIGPDDILVVSGSFEDYNIVHKIAEYADTKKIFFDIPKIEYAVKEEPFFIKPNLKELEAYFNCDIYPDELDKYCKRLLNAGCKNILVSLGSDGAFFCNKNFIIKKNALEGKAVNTVCSGDSMVAGVLYAIANNFSVEEAVELGVVCGSATAFCEHIAQREDIEKYFKL